MHLLHDVLRAAYPLLPEPFRGEHARLFIEEEHLTRLAERLFQFARQGVPAELPLPHFSAECTPPLSQAFAPFREVVVAWHEAPDSLDLPERMAGALVEAGCASILALLGQRCTPGSLTDARGIPPTRANLLASANQPHPLDAHLTVAGRALTKHAARSQAPFWGEVTGTTAEKNAQALRHIEAILDGATWWNGRGHLVERLRPLSTRDRLRGAPAERTRGPLGAGRGGLYRLPGAV
jgi:hypothetical protein